MALPIKVTSTAGFSSRGPTHFGGASADLQRGGESAAPRVWPGVLDGIIH